MNNYRKQFYAAAFSAVLAGVVGPAFAGSAEVAVQQSDLELQVDAASAAPVAVSQSLEGIVVTGNNNPLFRSDQRLALLDASLPLDAKNGAAQAGDLQRVVALFPESPDAATGEARRVLERTRMPVDAAYDLSRQ